MKIAFLGNFRVDYSTETNHLKTYRKLGHEVMLLQEGIDDVNTIMSRARKADLFVWTHTHGWHTQGMREALKELKSLGIPSVGYHLDLWLGLSREADLKTDPYWDIDYFFTVDKLFADHLNQFKNMPKAFYLPAGVFEDECYMTPTIPEYENDIIFVGSKRYHPEWSYRPYLIDWLSATYGDRFKLYGRDGKGLIRGDELNKLYSSTKIVIGDTLCKGFNYPYYLSDRIFETTGRGGFIIHPFITGLEDLFRIQDNPVDGAYDTSKAEIITYQYNNFKQLKYLIDYYLDNEEERESIRMRGFEKTRQCHTYTNRLAYLLNTINEFSKS